VGKATPTVLFLIVTLKAVYSITLQLVKIVHVQIRLSVFNLKQGEWNSADKVKFIFNAIVEFISGISALIDGPHFVVKFYLKNRPKGGFQGSQN